MAFCTACGAELGIGRYCTNCGQRIVEGVGDTTERPVVPASTPVPAPPVPFASGPRYPLFADEVEPSARPSPADEPTSSAAPAAPAAPAATPVTPAPPPRRHRSLPLLLLAGVAAVALLAIGATSLLGDEGARPTADAGGDAVPVSAPEEPTTLLAGATAEAPVTAPTDQSLDGTPVDYEVANLLDGDPATAWRMPGDGTGQVITMALPQESVITTVGLINGYAKDDRARSGTLVHWYQHNRRIEQVTWIFDDGTEVVQDLTDSPRLQQQQIDPVRTTTVRLRIDAVSAPGHGVLGSRDYTAISDVLLRGGPASA